MTTDLTRAAKIVAKITKLADDGLFDAGRARHGGFSIEPVQDALIEIGTLARKLAALASTPQPAAAETAERIPKPIADLIETEKERLRLKIDVCAEGMESSSDPWWCEDHGRARHELQVLEEAAAVIRQSAKGGE